MERFENVIIFSVFAKNLLLNLREGSEHVPDFKYVLNICKYLLKREGSEYASRCDYGGVLNIPGFRVCQVYAYVSVAQGTEYS